MGAEGQPLGRIGEEGDGRGGYLYEFKLYQTRSNFYMVGSNKSRTLWRVLKIDRLELSELNIWEDPTTYSEIECSDFLKRIDEANKGTGGLKFLTKCYGIIGFIKFLGPYYMLLITERRKIGVICGQKIYAINKTVMMPLPNSSVSLNMSDSRNEDRYKKLLCTVDLTKDFFFSYSYRVMCSLQSNLCEKASGHALYETMFVWNEFLTRSIRNHLKNTIWTVALVYGFFKQDKLSLGSKDFKLTLIARRSRHYAGTRYLKRGVNERGRVANDVETEQIVFEDVPEGLPLQISSVVQNRGSIPLFWSQETSRLNIKPDIILQKKDVNYEATRLHFGNLVKRYGNPIIILNLIKRIEKRPRESILRGEFVSAIDFINKELTLENRLRFLHLDLHMQFRNKATNVLSLLEKVTEHALKVTGFFYCRLTPSLNFDGPRESNFYQEERASRFFAEEYENNMMGDKNLLEVVMQPVNSDFSHNYIFKPLTLQKGVLRTNCIDCLDRTNVAQYTYGLAAIGHQLCALGLLDCPKMGLDTPLADDLMSFYEKMGDTLAFQYGGSAAHNKIFSERRGQWKAAIQSQEFFRTLQRYYNNAYMDVEKQDSINVFLGHFQPQPGKPTLWELRSDQHYNIGRHADCSEVEFTRNAIFKRSLSDGNILCESKTPSEESSDKKCSNSALPEILEYAGTVLAESAPEITTNETVASYSRCTPSIARRELFPDSYPESDYIYFNGLGGDEELDCSNFLDMDWLSSSGNSCEEETSERCTLVNSPCACLSSENVINGENMETTKSPTGSELNMKRTDQTERRHSSNAGIRNAEAMGEFSDSFIHWVNSGQTWYH